MAGLLEYAAKYLPELERISKEGGDGNVSPVDLLRKLKRCTTQSSEKIAKPRKKHQGNRSVRRINKYAPFPPPPALPLLPHQLSPYTIPMRTQRSVALTERNINDEWGENSISECTVQRWYKKCREGYFSLEGKGRRRTSLDGDVLRALLEENPRTVRELAGKLDVSQSTVDGHLRTIGKVPKGCLHPPNPIPCMAVPPCAMPVTKLRKRTHKEEMKSGEMLMNVSKALANFQKKREKFLNYLAQLQHDLNRINLPSASKEMLDVKIPKEGYKKKKKSLKPKGKKPKEKDPTEVTLNVKLEKPNTGKLDVKRQKTKETIITT